MAVFTYMPKAETARSGEDNRRVGRGQQSIRRFILERAGRAVVDTILAEKPALKDQMYSLLAHSGYRRLIPGRLTGALMKARLKGVALRLTQPDPCSQFLLDLNGRLKAHTETGGYAENLPELQRKLSG